MSDVHQPDPVRGGARGELIDEFWRRLQSGKPALQRCASCESCWFPPGPACPSCGSAAFTWAEPELPAHVVAWTVTRPAAADRLPSRLLSWVPYALAVIRFPDVEEVLLPALLTGEGIDDLVAGAAVDLSGGTPERAQLLARLVQP